MQRYDSYKDSGIQWLGEIPSHWKVCKTSYIFNHIGSGTTPNSGVEGYYNEEGTPFLQTGDLNDSIVINTAKKITDKAIRDSNQKIYPQGSLVIAMYGATIGKLGILGINATVNQACCVLPETKKIHTTYAYYLFLAAKKDLLLQSKGGGQPNISQEIIKNEKIVIPPLPEQQAIASYLDTATAKIDEAIAQQQKMIDLLNERKQIIINNAITKGLNPNAKMKPSGIDWIGNIPEHWEVMPLKYCMRINNGRDYKEYETDDGIPVIGTGGQFAYSKAEMYSGEVVFFGRKGTIDKPFHYNGSFWAVDTVFYAIAKGNIICKYLYYLGTTIPFGLYSTSTAIPSMTQTDLLNNPVALPPIDQQKEIVEYLDGIIAKHDEAITNATKQITLLQERKQIIINDVVTGKVKV